MGSLEARQSKYWDTYPKEYAEYCKKEELEKELNRRLRTN